MTRESLAYLGAIVALFLGLLYWLIAHPVPASTYPRTETTVVKVMLKNGHGSGVSVGNGYVITAAHVVKDVKTVTLKTKDGKTRQADVLWANTDYDIALLRSKDTSLNEITSYGNPLWVEFASAYGRIAGEPREFGHWRSVFVTDITTVMGMSGGPVFDSNGNLVGITVGVMGAPIGFSHSLVGYGFVVPSRAVCDLLARGMPA